MRFQCLKHGEVDEFHVNGYSIAHETEVKAHERDFEGITFVVDNPRGDDVSAEHVRPKQSRTTNYLEKFADWDGDIAAVLQRFYETGMGVEELKCPHEHDRPPAATHIVDEVFTPSFEEDVGVSLIVRDNVLNVDGPHVYEGNNEQQVFETIVEEARERESIDRVEVKTRDIETFRAPLEALEFNVSVKERGRGRFSREVLVGELTVSAE